MFEPHLDCITLKQLEAQSLLTRGRDTAVEHGVIVSLTRECQVLKAKAQNA